MRRKLWFGNILEKGR